MVVGRHVVFSDGSRLRIFRRAHGEARVIKDEPGFRLTVDPPLPAHHLYQQHRQQHDPPVTSKLALGAGWVPGNIPCTGASMSSLAKGMVLCHFNATRQGQNGTSIRLNRYHTNGSSG